MIASRLRNLYSDWRELRILFREFSSGYKQFNAKNVTPLESYWAMRKLFILTNGRFNDSMSRYLSIKQPRYKLKDCTGVLGALTEREVHDIGLHLRKNGYYLFETRLDEGLVKQIEVYARQTPARILILGKEGEPTSARYSDDMVEYDAKQPIAPKYQYTSTQIIQLKELQRILFDESLLAVAQEYLRCKPILDILSLWWSVPFGGKGLSEAAQLFHFDMDRLKFLKFFFYLTDVDHETGPHCYVRGSHRNLPKQIRKEGRLTDEEVRRVFRTEDMLEFNGPKGTILAVDTRGLHKGKPPLKKERLLFQIQFSNSMFGQLYPFLDRSLIHEEFKPWFDQYTFTYGQLFR